MNTRISALKKIGPSTLVVESFTKDELNIFRRELTKTFPEVTVVDSTAREPEIVIHDIDGMTETDITTALQLITQEAPRSVRLVKTHSGRHRAYLRVSAAFLRALEADDPSRVIIGYRRCRYERYISVRRCFKCFKFGHLASVCKCSAQDLLVIEKLKEKGKCSNCWHAEMWRRKRESNTEQLSDAAISEITSQITHSTFDSNCPLYQQARARMTDRYAY